MAYITIPNLRMAYDSVGNGTPMLLIHGYPLSRRIWQPQLEGLSDAFRVIALDLRGFGESQAIPGPYPMDLMADDCASFLDALGVNQPVIIGGLSMGGYIAFAFWRKYQHRVRGLMLTATRALPDSAESAENRLKAAALAEKEGPETIARAMLPKMLSPKSQANRPDLVAQVKSIMESASVLGIVGALLGMRLRIDSTPTLRKIKVGTLIFRGTDDSFVPMEEAQMMQTAIPNARLVLLPDAGHLPNLEQPVLFNQTVREFFTKV